MSTEDQSGHRPRRRRGLLKMYYGSDNAEPKQKKQSNPLDIDGDNFDHKRYLKKLLHEEPLQSLIKKESTFDREVKSLESDMQTLVYENYNKFISATDTIRHMKDKVDSMEEEMEKLQKHMAETASMSTTINKALKPKRDEIRGLVTTHTTLQHFQFLFELPTRLQECLDMGMKEQAINYYAKGLRASEEYKDKESFRNILTSCLNIMEGLHAELKDQLNSPTSTTRDVQEVVSLLAKLGMDDTLSLADLLLARAGVQWTKDEEAQTLVFERELSEFKKTQNKPTTFEKESDEEGEERHAKRGDGKLDIAEDVEDADATQAKQPQVDQHQEEKDVPSTLNNDDGDIKGKSNEDQKGEKKGNNEEEEVEEEEEVDPNKEALFAGKKQPSATKKPKKAKKNKMKVKYTPLQHLITSMGKTLFFNFAEWIICFQDIFLHEETGGNIDNSNGVDVVDGNGDDDDDDDDDMVEKSIVDIGDVEEVVVQPVDEETRSALEKRLSDRVYILVVDGLLPHMQAKFEEYIESSSCNVSELCYHLEQFLKRVDKLHGVIVDTDIMTPTHALISSAVEQYVNKMSQFLVSKIRTEVAECATSCSSSQKLATQSAAVIFSSIIATYDDCCKVTSSKFYSSVPMLSEQFLVKQLLDVVVLQSLDEISIALDQHCKGSWASMAAYSICSLFVSTHLPGLSKHMRNGEGSDISDVIRSALRTKLAKLQVQKKRWLQQFVQALGATICHDVYFTMDGLIQSTSCDASVDNPDHCFTGVVTSLAEVYEMVSILFGKGIEGRTSLASFSSRIQSDGVMNIHRLFSDAIKIYSGVEESTTGVMKALMLIFIKGFSDNCRQFTLTQAASKTMQVALFHLHHQFAVYVDSDETESSLNVLFARAVSAILLRCDEEPELLHEFEQDQATT